GNNGHERVKVKLIGDERTYRRRRRRSILPPENVETPERDGRDDVGEKEASFERKRKRLVLTVLTNSLEVAEPEEGAVDERLPSRLFYRMFLKGHKRWKSFWAHALATCLG
ncbi:hypothetical protein HID58_025506, partial [Brassica napus]